MQVILITDNDINAVIAVYTLKKFIQETNKKYSEYNDDFNHFSLDTLYNAIDWYVKTSVNLSIDVMEVETSLDDEV